MNKLTPRDQTVLRLLSEGVVDHQVCRQAGISEAALKKCLHRIEARAAIESDDAGRFYEKALKTRAVNRNAALEARFHALMEILPQAVLVIDGRSGVIKEFNQKACELFGYTSRVLRRMKVEQLMSEDLHAIHVSYRLAFLKSIRKREMGYHPSIAGVRRDGTEVPMSIALTATVQDDDVMVVCTELGSNAHVQDGQKSTFVKGSVSAD